MSARAASWLAWSLAGLSFAMFAANIALYILTRATPVPSDWGTGGVIGNLLIPAPFLAFPIVGALIASRHPHNAVGWICLADGLLSILSDMIGYYSVYGVAKPGSVPFPVAIDALGQWLWVPSVGLLGIYLILFFPDGKLPSRRWRPLAWFSGAVMVLVSLSITLAPGPLPGREGVRNPFGLEGHPWVTDAAAYVVLLLPVCFLASAASLVLRYRRSRGEERQQIKWIAFAASLVGLMSLITVVSASIFAPEFPVTADRQPLWLGVLQDVEQMSFAALPISVGFAVLRYRLYEIDLLINRALVYGALTVTLILVYAGCVVSLQYVFRALTGGSSQLVIVASTLAIAALFNPLRRRVQVAIDRLFYRRKYDAKKILEAYSVTLRNETDLGALNSGLLSTVRDTMQPEHVSFWLAPAHGKEGDE